MLTEGDEILSINSIPCRELDASAVADIIVSSPKHVTIVAKKFEGHGMVVAFDGASSKRKGRMQRNATNSYRVERRIGPGCQLLAFVVFCAATGLLIFYFLHARLGLTPNS